VKHRSSSAFYTLGEAGELNRHPLLAGVSIASPGEVNLAAPLDISTP